MKPTGDSGNPNSLIVKSQKLYKDIMLSADAATYGDEDDDGEEEQENEEIIEEEEQSEDK